MRGKPATLIRSLLPVKAPDRPIGWPQNKEIKALATRQELSEFLESNQRRAFRHAFFATHNEETSLDIAQDAMLRLSEKYGDRPLEELPLLFQRILQNAIRDHFRRTKVRATWTTLLSGLFPDDEDGRDPLEAIDATGAPGQLKGPEEAFAQSDLMRIIEEAVGRLPARQREAFLLRYWEDLDIAETALAMGCSEGSVKTHCSRATHALAAALNRLGISL